MGYEKDLTTNIQGEHWISGDQTQHGICIKFSATIVLKKVDAVVVAVGAVELAHFKLDLHAN